MKMLPKAALLTALMIGTSALPLAAPAFAKKKEAAADVGPKFTVNDKVRAGQAAALTELNKVAPIVAASGGKVTPANQAQIIALIQGAEPGVAAAEAAAVTNDELYVATELRYRKESKLIAAQYPNDTAAQTVAAAKLMPYLDKLIANPVTPQTKMPGYATVGDYAFERGQLALNAKDYSGALANYQRSRAAGNTDLMVDASIVNAKIALKDYAGAAADSGPLLARYKAEGQKAPEPFYAVGIENAYRSKNLTSATNLEIQRLNEYPDPKNYHDALRRLQSRSAEPLNLREKLDVWRLMRASKSLADQREAIDYADDALQAGASREALVVLEEFRAGRSPATLDPGFANMYAQASTRAKAAPPPAKAEATARAGSDAQSALTAANFNYSAGEYAKAIELYKLAQSRNAPDKDGLLMSLGAAQAQSGDKAGAQATFQMVTSSPRKEIAAYWLAWLARA